jgi:hypothetical protein
MPIAIAGITGCHACREPVPHVGFGLDNGPCLRYVGALEEQKPETLRAVAASTYTLRAMARSAFPFSKVHTALSKIARAASNPPGAVL